MMTSSDGDGLSPALENAARAERVRAAAPDLLEALEAQVRAEAARAAYLEAMSATIGVPLAASAAAHDERSLREEAQRAKVHALKLRDAALAKARAAA